MARTDGVKKLKIILDDGPNLILCIRAAKASIEGGIKERDVWGYVYEDGTAVSVYRNKGSVRVYDNGKVAK